MVTTEGLYLQHRGDEEKCSLATEEQTVRVKRGVQLLPVTSVPVPGVPAPTLALGASHGLCYAISLELAPVDRLAGNTHPGRQEGGP